MTTRSGHPRFPRPDRWGLSILVALTGAALLWWAVVAPTVTEHDCGRISLSACSADAVSLGGAVLIGAAAARIAWLGVTAARRVRELARIPVPPELAMVATAIGTAQVVCLATGDRVAFCAGLWRPRVYVSLGAVQRLDADELAAVLAHENAHARRRDPLRGLVRRAGADVLFFAPLARRWDRHRRMGAELAADRAAVAHVGAPALAGALLGMATTMSVGTSAFGPSTDHAIDVRIAALTETTPPADPVPAATGAFTVIGFLAVVLVLCVVSLILAGGLH